MPDRLSTDDERRIEQAITDAELQTSGEIRIHIELVCNEDTLVHTRKIFHTLKMEQTADRNAVLLYVSLEDHKLAIYGDEGIHATLGVKYWSNIIDIISAKARDGDLAGGIVDGIAQLGDVLKKYYPFATDDIDELDNAISYGSKLV